MCFVNLNKILKVTTVLPSNSINFLVERVIFEFFYTILYRNLIIYELLLSTFVHLFTTSTPTHPNDVGFCILELTILDIFGISTLEPGLFDSQRLLW